LLTICFLYLKKIILANFKEVEHFILQKLERELPKNLYYHSLPHTLDVLQAALQIGKSENINEEGISLLRVGALFHDSGFIYVYKGHEEKGCDLAKKNLPGFGFTHADIDAICGMIMATRIPQSPKNAWEKIICDADLDYLGRNDFYPISQNLYREFMDQGIVHNEKEWNRLQVNFFESHHYHTAFSSRERAPIKQNHLEGIKKIVASYEDEL
jgi:uncharacterized protein